MKILFNRIDDLEKANQRLNTVLESFCRENTRLLEEVLDLKKKLYFPETTESKINDEGIIALKEQMQDRIKIYEWSVNNYKNEEVNLKKKIDLLEYQLEIANERIKANGE